MYNVQRIQYNGIEKKTLPTLQPLDSSLVLQCDPRPPEGGRINSNQPVEYLDRLVRDSAEPFKGAFSFWNDNRPSIWRVRQDKCPCPSLVVPGQVSLRANAIGEVSIATQDEILIVEEFELSGQGRIKPAVAIKSLRGLLTDSIENL